MGLRKRSAAIGLTATAAAAALAIAGCSSGGSSATGTSSGTAAPATLTVWRMGSSVPTQVTWMNSTVAEFHKEFPAYAKTKVTVKWIPWGDRTQDWNNALSSGKNVPGSPASDPTFSTAPAQAVAGGTDGIIINGSPTDAATMIKAIRGAGYKGKIAIPSLLLPPQVIKTLGSAANGIIVSDATEFTTASSNPGVKQYLADMHRFEPGAAVDDASVQGWSGMELFAKAAASSSSLTPAGFTAAFKAVAQPIDLGTSGPWSVVGRLGKVPGFSRVVNPTVALGTVRNGRIVPLAGGFVNPLG